MKRSQKLLCTAMLSLGLVLAGGANAALVASADGQTVYDTDLNVTWLADANLAATNTFGLMLNLNGTTNGGLMAWSVAQSWITAMNAHNYLGYNDWRLPTNLQGCGGYYCTGTDSEMGHLFYELGGALWSPIAVTHNANYSLFRNLSGIYWYGTADSRYIANAWSFNFGFGDQTSWGENSEFYAMAVRPGQVTAVPVPAATWLLGSGLLGLLGVARKRKAVCRGNGSKKPGHPICGLHLVRTQIMLVAI